jgi:two-component system nitrogen regulation response regulator NtrX
MAEISAEYGRRPKEFSNEAMDLLRTHKWPGNVRELRNIVERLLIMTPGERVESSHLPASLLGGLAAAPAPVSSSADPDFPSLADAREDFEKRYITRKYRECGGNMSRLAETLQVERSNLYRKMKGYGLLPMRKGEPVESDA